MEITVTINTDNAAFSDGNAGAEVARILRKFAKQVEDWPGNNQFRIVAMDVNGNKVGAMEATK